jgi:thiamine pyrophosphokinase
VAVSGPFSSLRLRGLGRGRVRAAVVVLNGAPVAELRRAERLARSLADERMLVAVDGGLKTCRAARRRPDLFVGDGDSVIRVPADLPVVPYDTDKDFSDFAGALREVARREARVVIVAGLAGGRLDHEWANLLELGRNAKTFAAALAPTTGGTVLVTSHGCGMDTRHGSPVSLFALGASATVTLRGTRWTLARQRLHPGSRGLSNETGRRLDLQVHAGSVALVFPAGT